ncbi:hypothetical protein [Cohnella thailandensis]|uniref:Uncharacterized protein n=1 Tax=Cohnella thailandensis TaxID=557557 RepID=A0A841STZ1_9BACL|nr:hypothetical protein [Cohnella thailandensis]MBB6633485.1 hypothetical protein [Cohnella thailandensis]MBP1974502.1 hypothetical protein [Cohnella thailandensis]
MTEYIFGVDGMIAFWLMLVWGIAVYRTGRIAYSANYAHMRRRALGAFLFVILGIVLVALRIATGLMEWPQTGWREWHSRFVVQLIPMVPVCIFALRTSVLRLWTLYAGIEVKADSVADPEQPLDAPARRKAADPALKVPIQLMAFISVLAFYLTCVAAEPIGWITAVGMVLLPALSISTLQNRAKKKRRRIGRVDWVLPSFTARTSRGSFALAIIAIGLTIWLAVVSDEEPLPGRNEVGSGTRLDPNADLVFDGAKLSKIEDSNLAYVSTQ